MKRIKAACLEQTIHFQIKEDLVPHETAVRLMHDEYAGYKSQLDRKGTKYVITEEQTQPDDSIIIKIKRQYNTYDCGDYLG